MFLILVFELTNNFEIIQFLYEINPFFCRNKYQILVMLRTQVLHGNIIDLGVVYKAHEHPLFASQFSGVCSTYGLVISSIRAEALCRVWDQT